MKYKVFVSIGFFGLVGIFYAAQPPVVPAAQHALPTNVTLQADDGTAVTLPRAVVQQYAPGLFALFNPQFKEGQTGILEVHELDGKALVTFRNVFEKMVELIMARDAALHQRDQALQKALAAIVYPVGEEAREKDEKEELIGTEEIWKKNEQEKLLQSLQKMLENAPQVGDFILQFIQYASLWKIDDLARASAMIAAENLDISEPEDFANLTHQDFIPSAQLFILEQITFTQKNWKDALRWIIKLLNNSLVTADQELKRRVEDQVDRMVEWIEGSIIDLLRSPSTKQTLLDPTYAIFADKLIKRLQKDETLFTMSIKHLLKLDGRGRLYSLGNGRVGLTYSSGYVSVIDQDGAISAPIEIRSEERIGSSYVPVFPVGFLQNDGLRCGKYLVLFFQKKLLIIDLDTSTIIFNKELTGITHISDVFALDQTHLLIHASNASVGIFDIEHPSTEFTRLSKHKLTKIRAVQVVDSSHFLVCKEQVPLKLELWKIEWGNPLNAQLRASWPLSFNIPPDLKRTLFDIVRLDKNHFVFTCRNAVIRFDAPYPLQIQRLTLDSAHPAGAILGRPITWARDIRYTRIIPISLEYVALVGYLGGNEVMSVYSLDTQEQIYKMTDFTSFAFLDRTHIVYVIKNNQANDLRAYDLYMRFIPEMATLAEILDELQRNFAPSVNAPESLSLNESLITPTSPTPKRKRPQEEEQEEIELVEEPLEQMEDIDDVWVEILKKSKKEQK